MLTIKQLYEKIEEAKNGKINCSPEQLVSWFIYDIKGFFNNIEETSLNATDKALRIKQLSEELSK